MPKTCTICGQRILTTSTTSSKNNAWHIACGNGATMTAILETEPTEPTEREPTEPTEPDPDDD